jgi:hypothetical protein
MERCMVCGQIAEMIWVHGHYQCSTCRQVTVPCCNGETAQHEPPAQWTHASDVRRAGRSTRLSDTHVRSRSS